MKYFAPRYPNTMIGLVASAGLLTASPSQATDVDNQLYTYQSSFSSDSNGLLDLKAELHYDNSLPNAPIAVVMHQYSTVNGASEVRANSQRLRDEGFFVIAVSMRGRGGSDGVRDSGGLEIHDIYDAVESIKADASFSGLIDTTNVHITGYSGGGGNVMSALTKMPDYFRAGSSFFGMSDYGYDATNGWYNNGAGSRTSQLDSDIGNPNTGGDAVLDRYHARASNLASQNNPYSEIHLFVNSSEGISPLINSTSYRDNAIADQSFSGEFNNITVHIGDPTRQTWEDFNNNGIKDAGEEQNWPHGLPNADRQNAGEQWYRDRLLSGSIAQPTLNDSDSLFVAGFILTEPFKLYLGSGEDTAGLLDYVLSEDEKSFSLDIATSDLTKTGKLLIDTTDMAGQDVEVRLDGELIDTFVGGGLYEYNTLSDDQTLVLSSVPEPGTCLMLGAGALCLLRRNRRD